MVCCGNVCGGRKSPTETPQANLGPKRVTMQNEASVAKAEPVSKLPIAKAEPVSKLPVSKSQVHILNPSSNERLTKFKNMQTSKRAELCNKKQELMQMKATLEQKLGLLRTPSLEDQSKDVKNIKKDWNNYAADKLYVERLKRQSMVRASLQEHLDDVRQSVGLIQQKGMEYLGSKRPFKKKEMVKLQALSEKYEEAHAVRQSLEKEIEQTVRQQTLPTYGQRGGRKMSGKELKNMRRMLTAFNKCSAHPKSEPERRKDGEFVSTQIVPLSPAEKKHMNAMRTNPNAPLAKSSAMINSELGEVTGGEVHPLKRLSSDKFEESQKARGNWSPRDDVKSDSLQFSDDSSPRIQKLQAEYRDSLEKEIVVAKELAGELAERITRLDEDIRVSGLPDESKLIAAENAAAKLGMRVSHLADRKEFATQKRHSALAPSQPKKSAASRRKTVPAQPAAARQRRRPQRQAQPACRGCAMQ